MRHALRFKPVSVWIPALLLLLLQVCACSEGPVDPPVPVPQKSSAWFWQNPLPQENNLLYVFFFDANTGVAVGEDGTILRTTDSGATWAKQTSGTTVDLFAVRFTDANAGTAVGESGTIFQTENGGTTWGKRWSGTRNWLYGVSFTSAYTGTAVGAGGTILRTIGTTD